MYRSDQQQVQGLEILLLGIRYKLRSKTEVFRKLQENMPPNFRLPPPGTLRDESYTALVRFLCGRSLYEVFQDMIQN